MSELFGDLETKSESAGQTPAPSMSLSPKSTFVGFDRSYLKPDLDFDVEVVNEMVGEVRKPVAAEVLEAQLMARLKRERMIDFVFRQATRVCAALIPAILIGILIALTQGSWPSIQKFGFSFFTSAHWDPVAENFGALVPIYGTLVTSAIALIIAIPVSFGIALFLTELSPRFLRTPLGIAVELLAAVPSIIYGMWGLFVFAPWFAAHLQPAIASHVGSWPIVGALFSGPSMGIGMFTAGLILAIMIVPFISSVMRDVFMLVPPLLKESAYGMGATTWEVVWRIVLPQTRIGVLGGVILGLGRAFGETMAVTFVIGNAHDLSTSLFMPGSTISSALANEFTEAVGTMYTSSLIELGLILFLVTFVVLAAAKMLLMHLKKANGTA